MCVCASVRGHAQFLTYYELDLGLNHVIRKWSEPTERSANLLIPVPGGGDGPGGVLVCAENWIVYKHQGHREVRTLIPRRYDTPEGRGVLVVAHATHKQRGLFFFLVQTEYGDLFKVTLDWEGTEVRDVRVKYFDTTPVATSLVITKAGFLFVASELGNQCVRREAAGAAAVLPAHAHCLCRAAACTSSVALAMMTPRWRPPAYRPRPRTMRPPSPRCSSCPVRLSTWRCATRWTRWHLCWTCAPWTHWARRRRSCTPPVAGPRALRCACCGRDCPLRRLLSLTCLATPLACGR